MLKMNQKFVAYCTSAWYVLFYFFFSFLEKTKTKTKNKTATAKTFITLLSNLPETLDIAFNIPIVRTSHMAINGH